MRVGILAVVLLLSACVGPLEISGPFAARLSDADIRHIKLVVSAQPDVDHGIRKIEAVRPNKVRVETGHIDSFGGWKGSGFFLAKRSGKWFVDKSAGFEATAERTVVTD
jgi:hypothetical protein